MTISGVLDQPGRHTREPSTTVHPVGPYGPRRPRSRWSGTTTGGSDGSYSFTDDPDENTVYQVRTSLPPKRHSAVLFEGVRDIVTLTGELDDLDGRRHVSRSPARSRRTRRVT